MIGTGRLVRGGRTIARALLVWLAVSVALRVLQSVLPGFRIEQWWQALVCALALGVLMAVIWPLVVRLVLPVALYTVGMATYVLLGAAALGAFVAVPGVEIADLRTAVVVVLAITGVTALISSALALDEDELFYRRAALRSRHRDKTLSGAAPGVVFLQIDGLGYPVVQRAMRDGHMPELASWHAAGSHTLTHWHTDWSSQSAAAICGILHGSNWDIPAYRWYDKKLGRVVSCLNPRDAVEIERSRSDGRGLLAGGGASRGSLFTGDADHASLTMSSVAVLLPRKHRRTEPGKVGAGYAAYFTNPINAVRTFGTAVAELIRELLSAAAQRRANVHPRVSRGGLYPFKRVSTTVITRDVTVAAVLEDMLRGRPVVFADFLGYDEVAHHSGPERIDSLITLRSIDQQIGRLRRARQLAPRSYHFVVLSDHGQTQGWAFADRFGESIEDLVERVCAGDRGASDVVTTVSGHLAMVSLTDLPGRVSREDIEDRHPRLLAALVAHPGVGFVLVRSAVVGPVVLGSGGEHRLATGRVIAADPLAGYGPHAADLVRRMDAFPSCADIVINSRYDPESDMASPFEPHVGSHGGLGGAQNAGFILHPTSLRTDGHELVGAESLYTLFRAWITHLGHEMPAVRSDDEGQRLAS